MRTKHIRSKSGRARQARRFKVARRVPQTAKQYFALSEQSQEIWIRVTHVISKMRADHLSLLQASREFQIDPRTVVRKGGTALRKTASGRYVAKPSDRLLRVLRFPTPSGMAEIALRDSREASELAKYSDAVQKYVQTGDASELLKFEGKQIIAADGTPASLLTNLRELDRLGSAGVLSFESLYARTT